MDAVTAPAPVRVYWQRWWILAVFSVLTMWNCSIWNTFGPMASTAKRVSNLEIGTECETLIFVTRPMPGQRPGLALGLPAANDLRPSCLSLPYF